MNRLNTYLIATFVGFGAIVTMAADPYAKADETWISISGTVVQPETRSFLLDYGENIIKVEVDDWDIYSETYALMDGDRVTVYGKVDEDLFEMAKIEAGAVYLEGLSTYIYASSADEEGATEYYPFYWRSLGVPVTNDVTIRGTVSSVSPEKRQFKISRGPMELTVETAAMNTNPLDKYGFQRIEQGDIVSVSGNLESDFIGSRVLRAEAITTLLDASQTES